MNYIFDIDGTLTKDYGTTELLPNVGEFFAKGDYGRIGFASNQGGVGLKLWMESWSNPPGDIGKYPTATQAVFRALEVLNNIAQAQAEHLCFIGALEDGLRLAFAYRSKKGEWSPEPPYLASEDVNFWRRDWRKPAPGMLLDLIEDWGVKAQDVTMVGDDPKDLAASLNAGTKFAWAHDFFGYVPELLWLEGSRPDLAPENLNFPTGDDLEGVTRVYPPIRYYRLVNGPPDLEVVELDEALGRKADDEKFRQAMDDISAEL